MRIPFLKNFRRGFATNSSSSHSFVYLKEAQGQGSEHPGAYMDSEFGWGDFRLDTVREKLFYFLVSKIGGGWSDVDPDEEYDELGEQFPELDRADFAAAAKGYVDHQSQGIISAEEARDEHVAVFGGNDNSSGSQERVNAIRRGEVDWTRTVMDYDDLQHIPMDDEDGQAAAREYLKDHPWARSMLLADADDEY